MFRDFLIWYNLNIVPFLQAPHKQNAVFADKGIDMFKTTILLSGPATSWLIAIEGGDSKHQRFVQLINRTCSDLCRLIRDNLMGGPSMDFHRHHEKGVTKLRAWEFGESTEKCNNHFYGCYWASLSKEGGPLSTQTSFSDRIVEGHCAERRMHQDFGL